MDETPRSRPLLPSQKPRSNQPCPPPRPLPKRQPVSVACELCRKRKSRCDGSRPSCKPCRDRKAPCVYPPDESTVAGLAKLKGRAESLRRENARLWDFFRRLGTMSKDEVDEVIAFTRTGEHTDALLRLARQSLPFVHDGQNPDGVQVDIPRDNARLLAIDLRALANSSFRVSARPWTTIAGDGVVSDLVSAFFRWDDLFFAPFIDREAFLQDMREGQVETAKYCSPFLVNAICALRFFTSRAAKTYAGVSGKDLGFEFYNEAKKLWTLENNRTTLPTVQGLAVMFIISANLGTDRQGLMYRYAAYEMLRRLDLPAAFNRLDGSTNNPNAQQREREIISKSLWGFFCFESIVGYVYLQQSLIPPPSVPRCFQLQGSNEGNLNVHGNPFTKECAPPPWVPGILDATCDLSEIMYRVMQWNSDCKSPGSEEDISQRKEFYDEVQAWRDRLPDHIMEETNFTTQTCFLRVYTDEIIIGIFRPLHPGTIFDVAQNTTAGDVLIQCALRDTRLMRRWIEETTLVEYSCMTLCGIYNSALIMVGFLGDPRVQVAFVEVCMMLRQTTIDFPMTRFILQGLLAMAWSLDKAIPARAVPYFQNLGGGKDELRDLPVAFALPKTEAMRQLLGDEGGAASDDLAEMGTLLSKWSAMSIR